MWMELELPQREPPERGEPFTGARGIRGWLQEIEQLSDRDATVRFIEGLQRFNRLELAHKRRFKGLEQLRPSARHFIGRIVQRINTQKLPLDDLSYRNFHALLTLLRELALGYDIVADAIARQRRPSRRGLARAVERALACRGETMMRCAPVHAPLPQVFWHDAHVLYRLSEAHGCAKRRVANDELVVAPRKRQSPLDIYRRLLLFGVTPTEGLRRGQAERLYHRLEDWCRLAELSPRVPKGERRTLFHVDLAAPDTPQPGAPQADPTESTRVLDASAVLAAAERLLPDAPSQNAVLGPDQVDGAALQRLIDSWSGRAERRGERAARSEPADVEASLRRIRERLIADAAPAEDETAQPRREPTGSASSLALQTIERPGQVWQGGGQRRDLPGTWGEGEQSRATPAKPSRKTPEQARNWALVDASAGGFRLRWEGGSSSPAAVGELLALRQQLPTKGAEGGTPRECWTLGVIRRIKMVDDRRFDAGVETLGRHPTPATVRHEPANPHRKRDRKSEPSEPALVLPPMRSRDVPPTVLVPAQMFREGDVLELDLRERMLRVRLGPARESSSAFSRFELTAAPTRGRRAGAKDA